MDGWMEEKIDHGKGMSYMFKMSYSSSDTKYFQAIKQGGLLMWKKNRSFVIN